MKKISQKNIDFKKYPFRGILSEIARETGKKRQNVRKALDSGNPYICELFINKFNERNKYVASYKNIAG